MQSCYEVAAASLRPSEHLKLAVRVDESDSAPAATASASTADAASPASRNPLSERILAVVSNVDAGHEQVALLVLRPRASDGGKTASVTQCLPLVDGLTCQRESDTPPAATSASTDAAHPPAPALIRFSISSGRTAFKGETSDDTGLTDLFTVIEAQVKAASAVQDASSKTASFEWIKAYTDHTPAALAAPIFSRFTSSSFAPSPSGYGASTPASTSASLANTAGAVTAPPQPTAPAASIQHAGPSEIKVSIHTWNVNGQQPPISPAEAASLPAGANGQPPVATASEVDVQGIARWLRAEEESDVLVIGFQEFDLGSTAYLYHNPQREEAWTAAVQRALGRRAGDYTKLVSRQLVGIFSMVFVRTSILPCIEDVDTAAVGVGLGGFVANKGAMGLRFRVRAPDAPESEHGKTFCFVNAHLSAFEGGEALQRRRWDWNEIMKRLHFELDVTKEHGRYEGMQGIGKLIVASEKGLEVAPPPATLTAAFAQMNSSPADMAAATVSVPAAERNRHRKWRRRWAKERQEWLDERRAWMEGRRDKVRDMLRAGDSGDQEIAASASATSQTPEALRIQLGILDHDIIFFSGDLNYRLDMNINEAKKMITKRQFATLLKFDQLNAERSIGAVFKDWNEEPINFAPTYKFDLGTNTYDTSEKQRTPAWCDRVLYHTPLRIHKSIDRLAGKDEDDSTDEEEDALPSSSSERLVRPCLYTSEMGPTISDHKPVTAVFICKRS